MIGPLLGVVSGFTGSILLGVHKSRRLQAGRDAEAELMFPEPEQTEGLKIIANSDSNLDLILDQNDKSRLQQHQERLNRAVARAKDLVHTKMYESGVPGMVVAVTVNGKLMWKQGTLGMRTGTSLHAIMRLLGKMQVLVVDTFSGSPDVDAALSCLYSVTDNVALMGERARNIISLKSGKNRVLASPSTVMRIASISKALTSVALGKLEEDKKIDLDRPITDFKIPAWTNSPDEITPRLLASHFAGIRHYEKNEEASKVDEKKTDANVTGEGEFYLNRPFRSVAEALEIFNKDPLLAKPGERFHYTTHGFTLLAAVMEAAAGEKFENIMKKTFKDLGLNNTYLDYNQPLIANRSRYYFRDKDHKLRNAFNVDNSCKWAGGGMVSNVLDLTRFGNAMLYSYQFKGGVDVNESDSRLSQSDSKGKEDPDEDKENKKPLQDVIYNPGPYSRVNRKEVQNGAPSSNPKKCLPGYLHQDTVRNLWTPAEHRTKAGDPWKAHKYALGWAILPEVAEHGFARRQHFTAFHTGGAVGASSILLIEPTPSNGDDEPNRPLPSGVVVAILCNLDSVGLLKLAVDLVDEFKGLQTELSSYRVRKVYQC